MDLYPYRASLAFDPITNTKAANAEGNIYALTDTGFIEPLQPVDANGLSVPLISNVDGILPTFYVVGHPSVNWVSGEYVFPLVTTMPLEGPPGPGIVAAILDGDALTFTREDGLVTDPVTIPTGPGGSDAAAASYINSADSETYEALTPYRTTNGKRPVGKSELVVNVLDYGADNTGTTVTQTAIQSAIDALVPLGGGEVFFPKGTYSIGAFVSLKDNVSLRGSGQGITVLKAKTGLTTAILVGTTANSVSNLAIRELTLDGDYATTQAKFSAIQVTAANRVIVRDTTILNVGGTGIAFGGGSTECTAESNTINGSGLHLGDSHGIAITNGSHRCKIRANRITGGKAMGVYVGLDATPTTDTEIIGNYIETISTNEGYECIGVTANCLRTIVNGNHCINSHDNGISITAGDSVVIGNIVDGAWNAGITAGGDNTLIVGNRIRNAGQDFPWTGTEWGGISLNVASNCVVVGNVIYDDQTTKTMSYGIKEIGSANNNVIMGNRARGYRLTEFFRLGDSTLAFVGVRPTITGSRGGNAAVTSLITALSNAGLVKDSTTA